MTAGFSADRYAKLLESLLSPSWQERRVAESLLFSLIMFQCPDYARPWQGEIGVAVASLSDDFLAALIDFWASRSLAGLNGQLAMWSVEDRKSSEPQPWRSTALREFPLADEINDIANMNMYGLGVAKLLGHIGPPAAGRVEQLGACLQHPDMLVRDTVVSALGSIGTDAKPALPQLVTLVDEKGLWCRPFRPAKALARIAADDPAFAIDIASGIDADADEATVSGRCGLLRVIGRGSHEVIDRLILALQTEPVTETIYPILTTVAELAAQSEHRQAELRQLTLTLTESDEAPVRAAAADALGHLGTPEQDYMTMLKLAADSDWSVRYQVHHAVSKWSAPDDELIRTVAADLGCFDGYDGEPHDAAVHALNQWGKKTVVALPAIQTWLESVVDEVQGDSGIARDALDLIENLGVEAAPLKGLVEQWLATECDSNDIDIDDDDADEVGNSAAAGAAASADPLPSFDQEDLSPELAELIEQQKLFDQQLQEFEQEQASDLEYLTVLAARIGFPLDEDIPGTETLGEDTEELPDTEERLERVLEQLAAFD